MNKRQKIVQEAFIDNEEAVIRRLKSVYNQALKDITKKSEELQNSINSLTMVTLSGELDDEAKKQMQSMIQSKVYQKQYQEALKKQVNVILDNMQVEEFKTVSEYLNKCYEDGFLGTMYDLHGQGMPLTFPIDQESIVRAVQLDSKISKGLYARLGEDVSLLKRKITATVSRGISTGMTFQQMAQQLSGYTNIGFNNAVRIARTEGHRIQIQSGMDACYKAKDKGADVVKQWDSSLDKRTRKSHQKVDGEIRELDEPFSNGLMFPGDPSGGAAEVVNCRCALLQRARWALDETELKTLKERAKYHGLNKNDSFDDFKKKYLKATNDIENEKISKNIDYAVDPKVINSRAYIDKFDRMTSDSKERRAFIHSAKEILKHRSGQNGEDLYLYNKTTKKWYKSTTGNVAGTPEYTDEIKKAISISKKGELISFHNHPASMPPSDGDINAALSNGYSKGYALCHDGKIYEYTASEKYIDGAIYDLMVAKFQKNRYTEFESQLEAMKELSKRYGFEFKEV